MDLIGRDGLAAKRGKTLVLARHGCHVWREFERLHADADFDDFPFVRASVARRHKRGAAGIGDAKRNSCYVHDLLSVRQ
ncbi:hypothetical protein HDG32_005312 [Paraburkholderia sp. CI2]|uniref:hypothetical protein n=1 Tax=Paraburkholderia sp. CI2 TaxID=2723093 RepID=UPI00161F403D|nr:hypothetical protein [Paraburkholderia sp. CI2]MBB5469165.1 hypothetical protein [Paraburkholderia sp. CI2]